MYDPFAVPQMQPPQMYPGGNPGGAPLQNPGGPVAPVPSGNHGFSRNNAFAGLMGGFGPMGGWQQSLADWRGQRPVMQGFTPVAGGPQDLRSALIDWRQQRPTFRSYLAGLPAATNPNPGV